MNTNESQMQILALCQMINEKGELHAHFSCAPHTNEVSVQVYPADTNYKNVHNRTTIYSGHAYLSWPDVDSQVCAMIEALRGFV